MTDNTSPVATLAARLPKGNGLTRAVPKLFDRRGALIPFVGFLLVEEATLDKDDVQKIRVSIARLELATGPLEHDAKDLVQRASTQATSVDGQGQLFAQETERDLLRAEHLAAIREWAEVQDPPVSEDALTERWNSWHGGHYDARLDHGQPAHLRDFAVQLGALQAEDVLGPPLDEPDLDEPADGDPVAELVTDDEPAGEGELVGGFLPAEPTDVPFTEPAAADKPAPKKRARR